MKKITYLLIVVTMLFASCAQDNPLVKEIKDLEQSVDKQPSTENIQMLLAKYKEFMNNNPEDVENNGIYSYKAAIRHLQSNNISSAIASLDEGIKTYGASSATPNSLYLMANTFKDKYKQIAQADTYYQALIEGFPNHEYSAKAKENMKKTMTLEERINLIKDDIYTDSTKVRADPRKVRKVSELYKLYAGVLPNAPNTPDYLYQMYSITNSARMFKDAAFASEKLYTQYPDHEKAPTAMFLAGFIYEDKLKNNEKAEAIYKEFLSKYPDNDFASSAKVSLKYLGAPADEMLKKLQDENNEE